MNKQVTIVGIGMDGDKTLTREAAAAIDEAQLLIGAGRMLLPFAHTGKPAIESFISEKTARLVEESGYEKIAVLVSGDCGFYSAAGSLLPLLKAYAPKLICGISTPVYFCSRLGLTWSDMKLISLHGADAPVVRNVRSCRKVFFLLGGKTDPSQICRRLCEYGMGNVQVFIGENLASEDEKISSGTADSFRDYCAANLCAMITINEHYERLIPSCIDDARFIRGNVPMTKAEVRGLCVAKLAIREDDSCWDIGCGTGSVAIEMAFRCPAGRVTAVDRNPEAISLTKRNRIQFGCDNIDIIAGAAQELSDSLPVPDCVFIGGSGGHLGDIVKAAASKNPDVRMVVTAVSLETLAQCSELFRELGSEPEITQLSVTRTRRVGTHTMLAAENPIYIIKRNTTLS